jgi:Leucine-rich repeat (LRR) protein
VIPDTISGLLNLEELNISSNILKSLPDSIGFLQKLKILNVSGNKLSALPDSIGQCRYRDILQINLGKTTPYIIFDVVNLGNNCGLTYKGNSRFEVYSLCIYICLELILFIAL